MTLVRSNRREPRIVFSARPSVATFPVLPAFEEFENRMNRFIERAFADSFGAPAASQATDWVPPMSIVETDKEFTISAELPGLDQKDVDVSVEDGLLTIKGEKIQEREEKKEPDEEQKKVYLYERSYGSFCRSFALPPTVDAARVDAVFKKGVLKVHLPKSAEAKPNGRKIEIKSV
jgi:HSP20 family protein